MSDVTVSINLSRKEQGALYMARLAAKKKLADVIAERDALKAEITRLTTPDFYWPTGDEGGYSDVIEIAQIMHEYDGTLWESKAISSAKELPDQAYRSFLNEKGIVQIELLEPVV
jgi:hypothetical protein